MLRIGLLGAGFMGQHHAAGWAATPAELAGVHSLDPHMVQATVDQYGGRAYESVDALIDDVDVVDVCTPTHLHHAMVLKAAAAGKHVICEKPLARSVQQAEEMLDVCATAGVRLLVGHVVRFFPQYAQAKALVDQGAIGDVAVVRLTRASFRPKREHDNWFLDSEKSGGMMLDLMLHDFDYARWVAGEVESVFARNVSSQRPGAPGDYALAILRHANGALSNVEGGWAYPPPLFRTSLQISGSDGLIDHPIESAIPLHVYLMGQDGGDSPDIAVPSSPLAESPYATQLKNFYEVLAHDAAPRVTAEDGLMALKIAFAAMESAQSGRPVRLQEV